MIEPRWRLIEADESVTEQLHRALGIHPVLCRILAQRGICTVEDARRFFRPSLQELPSPFALQDMERAVARLEQAVDRSERILLYGDYDVDGTTGVALLYTFFSRFHSNIDYYLPHREQEGYGISSAGVEYARRSGSTLIVAVDCGTHDHQTISLAKSYGIDVIVCDHHPPEGHLPAACAILNPRRADCSYPHPHLSGCGIAFKLAQALALARNTPVEELEDLLDFVALSTCCDLVPLVGENRALTFFGLSRMERRPRIGIWALLQQSQCTAPLSVRDMVFGVGPMLNAAGRLSHACEAVRLLLAAERNSALEQAARLARLSQQRRLLERSVARQAICQWNSRADAQERKGIVLFDPSCPRGIAGLVASRMVEHFYRPTIVLTQSGEQAVGSGRSVPGFNLHEALRHCRHLLTAFGGHLHAVGVQLPIGQVAAFAECFEEVVRQHLSKEAEMPELTLCAYLDFVELTPSFWRILKQFAPFGPGNMTPIFWAKRVRDTGQSRILSGGHVRLSVRQDDGPVWTGIGFGLAPAFERLRSGPFDLAYSIEEDKYEHLGALRIRARAVRPPSA